MAIEILQGSILTGTPITTTNLMIRRPFVGTVNGTNKTFTLTENIVAGSLQVILRDQVWEPGDATNGFTETGAPVTGVTLGTAVTAPSTGENFYYNGIKA